MKTTLLLLMSISICAFSQKKQENCFYKKAYNFLINTNELKEFNNIMVSDSIVYIELLAFMMNKESKNLNSKILDSLSSIDENRKFKNYSITDLSTIVKSSKDSKNVIFFSKVYKNTLLSEFFQVPDNISKQDYSKLTMFGSSKQFLIYFNRRKKIIKYIPIEMTYN